jgi:hypothetical protein
MFRLFFARIAESFTGVLEALPRHAVEAEERGRQRHRRDFRITASGKKEFLEEGR